MLKIIVKGNELYDEFTNQFFHPKDTELRLEHSLVSLSKWESTWRKPFLAKGNKTREEVLDYIRCMTLTQNVDPDVYRYMDQECIDKITEYINDPMTATTFRKDETSKTSNEVITSELIYYWMISFQIPVEECQKWHINRLLTLINVCNLKNQPAKKRSKREIMSQNKALNEARKAKYNTHG